MKRHVGFPRTRVDDGYALLDLGTGHVSAISCLHPLKGPQKLSSTDKDVSIFFFF